MSFNLIKTSNSLLSKSIINKVSVNSIIMLSKGHSNTNFIKRNILSVKSKENLSTTSSSVSSLKKSSNSLAKNLTTSTRKTGKISSINKNTLNKSNSMDRTSNKNFSTATTNTSSSSSNEKKSTIKFEVFGKVQRVFFRKYTKLEGKKLGLRGWCMNTPRGTVEGMATGSESQIEKFKIFLQTKGSPKSRIDKAVFEPYNEEVKESEFVIYR